LPGPDIEPAAIGRRFCFGLLLFQTLFQQVQIFLVCSSGRRLLLDGRLAIGLESACMPFLTQMPTFQPGGSAARSTVFHFGWPRSASWSR